MTSVSAFIDAIGSTALKQVANHWRAVAGDRKMPAWSDIKPVAITPQLPIVWAYKFDSERDEFTERLAGDRVTQLFGKKNFRGLPLSQEQPEEAFAWIVGLLKRVVAEPALFVYEGPVFEQLNRQGTGARMMLPLSSNGIVSDGILGVTEFQVDSVAPVSLVRPAADAERWFSLA